MGRSFAASLLRLFLSCLILYYVRCSKKWLGTCHVTALLIFIDLRDSDLAKRYCFAPACYLWLESNKARQEQISAHAEDPVSCETSYQGVVAKTVREKHAKGKLSEQHDLIPPLPSESAPEEHFEYVEG